jgi:hypothetical protein
MESLKILCRFITALIGLILVGDKAIKKDDDDNDTTPTIGIRG